jgi:hypothetical protein
MFLCTTSLVYSIAYISSWNAARSVVIAASIPVFPPTQKKVFLYLSSYFSKYSLSPDVRCVLSGPRVRRSLFVLNIRIRVSTSAETGGHTQKDERGKNRRAAALVASILFELEREETTSIRKHKRTRGTYIIRKKEKKKTRHNGLRHDGQGRAKEETTKRGKNYKELAAWAIDGRLLSSCPTAAVSQENERCCSCSMSTAKQQKKKYSI